MSEEYQNDTLNDYTELLKDYKELKKELTELKDSISVVSSYRYFVRLGKEDNSYNRKWTARYKDMLNRYEVLKKIAETESQKQVVKGFEMALRCFHERDSI